MLGIIIIIISVSMQLYTPPEDPLIEHHLIMQAEAKSNVSFWVYFTDKGIFNKADYNKAVENAKRMFPKRTLERRKKARGKEIAFRDLPVAEEYIQAIRHKGAVIKGVSRWFNAVVCEGNIDVIEEIAKLPFVRKISQERKLISRIYKSTIWKLSLIHI